MTSQKNKANKTINIRQYKTRREMNIGILIFAIVFVYLLITIFTYATDKRISVYEVRQGSIIKDYSYTGLILRDETLVHAESSGYISYYQSENSKVKTGSKVYAITADPIDTQTETTGEDVALSSDVQRTLNFRVQNFNENFSENRFSSVYSLKNDYTNTLHNVLNQSRNTQLDTLIAESGTSASSYSSQQDGILVLTYDGYESLKEDSLSAEDFDRSNYEAVQLEDTMEVDSGTPAYKLITDESWRVYVQLEQDTAALLADTSTVKVRIDKDNETTWADFSVLKKGEDYYGCLEFDDSMIRYCEERYLTIELILEDQSGLKIPKSAVVDKSFFIIPEEYLTTSGSGSSQGVMVQDGEDVKYVSASVYYTSEDGYVYLNPKDFKKGEILVKPESTDTCTLEESRTLQGVFNINQGYAVFKVIDILSENDDYYIVQEGTAYGLSDYDHIVQDGTTVKEEEVVL